MSFWFGYKVDIRKFVYVFMEILNYIKFNWVLGYVIVYKCFEIKLNFILCDMVWKYNILVVDILYMFWNNFVKFNFWN